MENNYLTHHGTKGMKWGIRRYQNKDGSLTPAGKKRYNTEMGKLRAEEKAIKNKLTTKAKMNRLDAKKKSVEELRKKLDESDAPKKKSVKEMTDEELSSAIRRAELEKRYNDLHPKQVSAGEKFVKEAVGPALTQASRSLMNDFIVKKGKEYLGLKDESDPVEKLQKEFNKLNLTKQIKDLKDTEYQKTKREQELEKAKLDIESKRLKLENAKKGDSNSKKKDDDEDEDDD